MEKVYELKCYEGNHPRILVSDDFLEQNRMKFLRTEEEILAKINASKSFFGFGIEVMIDYLSFKNAEQFLSKPVKPGVEAKWRKITDIRECAQDFLDYMVFGWMKALDQRGISASRTVEKIGAWMWLLGHDELEVLVNSDDLYNPYGMPALIAVCTALNIPVPKDCHDFAARKCEDTDDMDTSL